MDWFAGVWSLSVLGVFGVGLAACEQFDARILLTHTSLIKPPSVVVPAPAREPVARSRRRCCSGRRCWTERWRQRECRCGNQRVAGFNSCTRHRQECRLRVSRSSWRVGGRAVGGASEREDQTFPGPRRPRERTGQGSRRGSGCPSQAPGRTHPGIRRRPGQQGAHMMHAEDANLHVSVGTTAGHYFWQTTPYLPGT
jgi:hypothetical protein